MSKFVLDTSSVEGIANSISSIFSNFQSLAESINGYDVSNEDNFDFKSAKEAIYTNISAAVKKVESTSDYMLLAIESHSALQDAGGDGGYYGSYSGNGSSSSSGSYSSTTSASESSSGQSKVDLAISPLLTAGLLTEIVESEIDDISLNKTVLVLRVSKSDEKSADYIKMVTEIAAIYKIPVALIDLDKTSDKEKEPSTELIKNGQVLASQNGYLTEDEVKALFGDDIEDSKATIGKGVEIQNKIKELLAKELPYNDDGTINTESYKSSLIRDNNQQSTTTDNENSINEDVSLGEKVELLN